MITTEGEINTCYLVQVILRNTNEEVEHSLGAQLLIIDVKLDALLF